MLASWKLRPSFAKSLPKLPVEATFGGIVKSVSAGSLPKPIDTGTIAGPVEVCVGIEEIWGGVVAAGLWSGVS
jgi:hypothetical protein